MMYFKNVFNCFLGQIRNYTKEEIAKKLTILIISTSLTINAQTQELISYPLNVKSAIAFSVGTLKGLPNKTKKTDQTNHKIFIEQTNNNISSNVPFDVNNPPIVNDMNIQKNPGTLGATIKQNWEGNSTTASATDCNGAVGPNHYLQSVNFNFSVFDKQGNLLMGPSSLNTFFDEITPADAEGKGDPVVIFDEHANRWLIAQFASGPYDASYIYTNPNYIFTAVSQTADPTGAWYKWAFEVNAFPDYFKIGVGEQGYFIGSNPYYNPNGAERFMVMDRASMLAGDANPQLITFESSQIPGSSNGVFHVVQPVDTDGPFAPAGSPGVFITINDDVWGGNDELWIYEMNIDWDNTSTSSIQRTQTIAVEPFVSQFNTGNGGFNDLDCIIQKGTSTKLDAVSTLLMYRAQYRNFDGEQKIICYHTINVDGQNQSGLRWYELEKTSDDWSIRQQGTYAPDINSRWMGGIGMNGDKEIAIGYSISGPDVYPGIRFTGQSQTEYQNANGIFDIEETTIYDGTASKTSNSRWVDYTNLTIDPTDDHTFWYTNSFVKNAYENGSYISAFEFTTEVLSAGFYADNTSPAVNTTVSFTDASVGPVTSWNWTITPSTYNFVGGTSSSSQNPQIEFTQEGSYSVTLDISDGTNNDQEIKNSYINVTSLGIDALSDKGEIIVFEKQRNIYCKVPSSFKGEITIYNTNGKAIYNGNLSEKAIPINTPGIYIVRIQGENQYYSGKISIK